MVFATSKMAVVSAESTGLESSAMNALQMKPLVIPSVATDVCTTLASQLEYVTADLNGLGPNVIAVHTATTARNVNRNVLQTVNIGPVTPSQEIVHSDVIKVIGVLSAMKPAPRTVKGQSATRGLVFVTSAQMASTVGTAIRLAAKTVLRQNAFDLEETV